MPPLKDDAQRGGDALQDGGQALQDIENGDPNSAAQDLAKGARALGLDGIADAIENALGLLEGPLPEMTYDLCFGKPTLAEDAAGTAEGLLGDAADQLGGGLLGSLAHTAVDRATKLVDDKIGGPASGWTLYSFKLTEEFSRPWCLTMTLVRPEVPATDNIPDGAGILTQAAQFVQGLRGPSTSTPLQKVEGAAKGLVESALGVSGLTSQADGSPAEQAPTDRRAARSSELPESALQHRFLAPQQGREGRGRAVAHGGRVRIRGPRWNPGAAEGAEPERRE